MKKVFLQVYYVGVMTANLNFLENTFTADRGQLKTELERNIFSNTSERLFLMLQTVCGKTKLALNQKYINDTQNQIPA